VTLLAAGALLPGPRARAQTTTDMIEHFFGASNINASAGNGGLSIGISSLGDLAVLTWPSPSFTDQVLHVASNDLDVRQRRQMMLHDSMGATVGLAYVTTDASGPGTGDATGFTWLRDPDWTVTQGYHDPEAAVVTTRYEREDLGLAVRVTDFVLPQRDVWVRHVALTRHAASPVRDATALWYSNLAPTVSRVPQLPMADWAFDAYNDYAALYDDQREAVLHYRPEGRGDITEIGHLLGPPAVDYGAAGDALSQQNPNSAIVGSLLDQLEADAEPGAYLAVGASAPLSGWQVGFDPVDHCALMDPFIDNVLALPESFPNVELPMDPGLLDLLRCEVTLESLRAEHGWVHEAESAWTDARDGRLARSRIAVGRVNEALAVPLTWTSTGADDEASVTFRLAAAATAGDALALLDAARSEPYADQLAATVTWWQDWIRRAALPDTDDERILQVCRRALINLKVGTDRETGAMVASISRQAPYGLDWPRDGAFFNAALDVAGYPEMVEKHQQFYLDTIRTGPEKPEPFINADPPEDPDYPGKNTFPAWSWEMNYYADGLIGGYIRFEIDNTALLVWSMVAHAGYLSDEADRQAYLERIWPTVRNATDLLARWRDPETGLQAAANEDDNLAYTQTLHGAVTVYAGLVSAARAARALADAGDNEALLSALTWETRAWELKQAVLTHLYDEDTGRFREGLEQSMNPEMAKAGPSAWLVWPARMLPFDDERLVFHLRATLEQSLAQLDPATGDGAYLTKVLIAAALALADPALAETGAALDPQDRADVEAGLQAMVDLVATPDTAIMGETFVGVDTDGDGVDDAFSTRVSNPHLWAATLVYLTAMALYNPETFDPHLEVLPPVQEPGAGRDGCGCHAPSGAAASPGSLGGAAAPCALGFLLLLGWLHQRRRRRPRRRGRR